MYFFLSKEMVRKFNPYDLGFDLLFLQVLIPFDMTYD